jgi:uridine phosphorylase
VILALLEAGKFLKVPFHLGITATAPGFYGAQGRQVPGFPLRYPNLLDDIAKLGVVNFEMETSTLLTLASLAKVRAGAVCAIYANRPNNTFITPEDKDQAELNCIHAGLTAIQFLYRLDCLRKEQQDPSLLPLIPLLTK